jgi:hypothetical protein
MEVGTGRNTFTVEEMRKVVGSIDLTKADIPHNKNESVGVWALNDVSLSMDFLGYFRNVESAQSWADDNTERWYAHYYTTQELPALMAEYS